MFTSDPTDGRREFGFLLLPGFSTLCLANSVEPLRAVNEITGRQCYTHRLLSLDGAPVTSSSGIEVKVDAPLDAAGRLDVFFLVSSYRFTEVPRAQLMPGLRRVAREANVVGGMDTGPWLLAAAGLLDGYNATIHWQEQERLQADFPEVQVSPSRYVIDGDRITCGGATTVLDLMLGLLRAQVGEVLALDVMRLFIYDAERPAEGEQQPPVQAPFAARAPIIGAAIAEMEQAIETPRPIAETGAGVRARARRDAAALLPVSAAGGRPADAAGRVAQRDPGGDAHRVFDGDQLRPRLPPDVRPRAQAGALLRQSGADGDTRPLEGADCRWRQKVGRKSALHASTGTPQACSNQSRKISTSGRWWPPVSGISR